MIAMIEKRAPSILFVLSSGPAYGLGHLRRMQSIARACQETTFSSNINFFVMGCEINDLKLIDYDASLGSMKAGSVNELSHYQSQAEHEIIFIDLHRDHITDLLIDIVNMLSFNGYFIVTIDHVAILPNIKSDLRWVPSFFKDPAWPSHLLIDYGWGNYLFEKKNLILSRPLKNRLLVLTGGSDNTGLGKIWPKLFEQKLNEPIEIIWVQGPFSHPPEIPYKAKHRFDIISAPTSLDDLFNACDWVLTVHGITVFEALSYNRPIVVFNPYSDQNILEMNAFEATKVAIVAHNHEDVIEGIHFLMNNKTFKNNNNISIRNMLDGKGAFRILERVKNLMAQRR